MKYESKEDKALFETMGKLLSPAKTVDYTDAEHGFRHWYVFRNNQPIRGPFYSKESADRAMAERL
jgi:hypothetical protein